MGTKRYRALLVNDLRQIRTDPVLMASLIGPVLLILISRYALPPLLEWVEQAYGLSLSQYMAFAAAFMLVILPVLIGSLTGLLMLDDRDENMIAYFAVTPLVRIGYASYRLLLPSLLTLLMGTLYVLTSGMVELRFAAVYTVILLFLEAPLIAICLTVFASNKVEGLAMTKAASLLFAGPVVAYFVPEPWSYAGVLIPTYWTAQAYLAGLADASASLGWFVGGFVVHMALLVVMLRYWINRANA